MKAQIAAWHQANEGEVATIFCAPPCITLTTTTTAVILSPHCEAGVAKRLKAHIVKLTLCGTQSEATAELSR